MLVFADKAFATAVAEMLEKDFAECRQATAEELASRPFVFHIAVRVARLFGPIL
jgi:cardiolipin synthase